MHIQSVIQRLGFKPNEVKVYLAALNLGESTVADLALKVQLPRTSVQVIIQELSKVGLLNCYLKRRRKFWVAENPDRLLIELKEREAALQKIMPELKAMRYETGAKPAVRLYNGLEEVRQILDDFIFAKHHILCLVDWDGWIQLMGKDFLSNVIERRSSRYLHMNLLCPRTKVAAQLKARDADELRVTRFLPEGTRVKNAMFIYGNKVAMISLNNKLPVGILIEDQDAADTQSVLFDRMWQSSLDY